MALLVGGLVLLLPIAYLRASADGPGSAPRRTVVDDPPPVIGAAGDISCDPREPEFTRPTPRTCQQKATSDLLLAAKPAAVLPLGDNQYKSGILRTFQVSYDKSWGRLLRVTHPVPGNHEYGNKDAQGYFDYFGSRAGQRTKGYYSYDIGTWHIIALNSECRRVGGCGAGSPQERWLQADLTAHPTGCTLAYWHRPRFSSGQHGDDDATADFWSALYAAGVEVALAGHDHDYERFAPQTPTAAADPARGIRQFVVGTGGEEFYRIHTPRPNSEVRKAGVFGVLLITLRPEGYDWQFKSVAPSTFTDRGSGTCH